MSLLACAIFLPHPLSGAKNMASDEDGYVLFDALVGLAIAALVMAIVTLSLRSAIDLNRRAAEEAQLRRDMMAGVRGLTRWLEETPLPDTEKTATALGQYPPENRGTNQAVLKIVSGRLMQLHLEPKQQGIDPVPLFQADMITLEHWPAFRILTPDLVVISFGERQAGPLTPLVFQHLRRFSPQRIAAPYSRKARATGTP